MFQTLNENLEREVPRGFYQTLLIARQGSNKQLPIVHTHRSAGGGADSS
jgi:hypothetical protein